MTRLELLTRILSNPDLPRELIYLESRAAEAAHGAIVSPERWSNRAKLRHDLVQLLTSKELPDD